MNLSRYDLPWAKKEHYLEATVGDYDGGDGVRFTLDEYPTCYRRGPWRLLVEVAPGPGHRLWGCFDDQDQPMRWYHHQENALSEADAIAKVLKEDRNRKKGERA